MTHLLHFANVLYDNLSSNRIKANVVVLSHGISIPQRRKTEIETFTRRLLLRGDSTLYTKIMARSPLERRAGLIT